jgi:hypothetical protein
VLVEGAFEKARKTRLNILDFMAKTIAARDTARADLSALESDLQPVAIRSRRTPCPARSATCLA